MDSETQGSDKFFRFVAWADRHKKPLLGGVVIILVAVAIGGYEFWRQSRMEHEAAGALLALEPPLVPGEGNDEEPPSDELLEVANEFPATRAGQRARLYAAERLFDEGDYQQALEQFEQLRQVSSDEVLRSKAAYGRAASLEAQGKLDEATEAYREVQTRFSGRAIANQATFQLARLHAREGRVEEAIEVYDELASGEASSYWANQAQQRRQWLLEAHPDLASKVEETAEPSAEVPDLGTPDPTFSAPAPGESGQAAPSESGQPDVERLPEPSTGGGTEEGDSTGESPGT